MKFLQQVAGRIREALTVQASVGSADADKIPSLDNNGRLDISMMPAGLTVETKLMPAFEALAAGDLVNLFLDTGVIKARKADASVANATRKADGFVLSAAASGANIAVYYGNINSSVAGLTIGADYFLSDAAPGAIVLAASIPTIAGRIVQRVGRALSATELLVEIDTPIELA